MGLTGELRGLLRATPAFVRLLFRLLGDSRISLTDRGLVAAAVLYALNPLDLLPDVLPFAGIVDDLYFVALALDRLLRNADPVVVLEHWDGPEGQLERLLASIDRLGDYLPEPVERQLARRAEEG